VRLAEQGKFQVKEKDHHESSTLYHMVPHAPITKVTSQGNWFTFKKLFLELANT